MQESSSAIPHWMFQVIQALGLLGLGGAAVKLLELYQNRRKPVVEVQKVEAETTEITIRAHAAAGDSMIRLMNRLDEALNTIDRLRGERDRLKENNDKQTLEIGSYEQQMRHMKAIMDLKGVKWSEFDEPKS